MAHPDVTIAVSGQLIKNGTLINHTTMTGQYSKLDTYVNNNPTIEDIELKYDLRFDDPSYYYGK